ncbi:hypothetical protein J3R82DRAFT_2727 [Butyriboletus roseoflavus]|nr:hypothetical protein J3R82DRAFT_2727 [Butyriboletus roseoflavus]
MRIYQAPEDLLSDFEINKAISETRSSDSAQLHEKLSTYILQNLKVNTMKSAINASIAKSELGLNHPQLARYLCPMESMAIFDKDVEG